MDILSPVSLETRRKQLGLSREELALEAKVDAATLWRIETGKQGGRIDTWRSLLGTLDRLEA